jgi:hypothetical protein
MMNDQQFRNLFSHLPEISSPIAGPRNLVIDRHLKKAWIGQGK